jgi:two-component system chemotaxis sensor kinase CheA
VNHETNGADEAFLAEFLDDYFAECDEHLAGIRRGLLAIESFVDQPAVDQDLLEELFRNFHSLKGMSGMVGVKPAEQLTHQVESYMRLLRRGEMALNGAALDALIAATKVLEEVISARRHGRAMPSIVEVMARLTALTPAGAPPVPPPAPAESAAPPAPAPASSAPASGAPLTPAERVRLAAARQAGGQAWRIEFTPAPELAQRGVNVNEIRSRLQHLGELLRAAPNITPQGGIAFEFLLTTPADPAVFAGWAGDGVRYTAFQEVAPEPEVTAAPQPIAVPQPAPIVAAPSAPRSAPPTPPPHGEPAPPPTTVVRVDLARLDGLMQMVGELVISRARLEDNLRRMEQAAAVTPQWHALQETNLAMERQIRDLREGVMRLRLVPIGEAFERMQFAVRDLARESGKSVALTLNGQTTEIDKYVVERILDPLLHLVRNAVSHGIEPSAERVAAGKPPQGRIALRAATAGDSVMLEIEDDGRGMDIELIARRARAAGLLAADAPLDLPGALDIICAPGFSTRDEADLASGRGVGMTVVRNTVQELGGTLALWTERGRGSRFTIELPLTLAIVDALIVSAGGQTFAMPQPSVREVAEVQPSAVTVMEHNELIGYRGGVLPVLRLARLFGLPEEAGRAFNLLVVGAGLSAVGIAISHIHGLREIVVRAITDPLIRTPGIAGATELGDGRVVLILDAQALARLGRETAASVGRNEGRTA